MEKSPLDENKKEGLEEDFEDDEDFLEDIFEEDS